MITVCVLTKNSQEELTKILPSVQFANQILVIDDHSTDNTESIARAHQCDFYKRALNNDFAAQRNYAIHKARGEWIFFIDPDETVSASLAAEVMQVTNTTSYDGFSIKREDLFLGKKLKHGETSSVWLVRLAKKAKGTWVRPVHETWKVENVGRLKNVLVHNAHQDIAHFLKKINYYTDIESNYRNQSGKKTNLFEVVAFPVGKFIQNYILRLGILDGMEGFTMAFMMSVHSFLVRAKQITTRTHL